MGVVAQERGDPAAARASLTARTSGTRRGCRPIGPAGNERGVGDLLVREGRQKEALGSYLRAARARPDEPAAYYRLGAYSRRSTSAAAGGEVFGALLAASAEHVSFQRPRPRDRVRRCRSEDGRHACRQEVRLPLRPVLVPDVTGVEPLTGRASRAAAG